MARFNSTPVPPGVKLEPAPSAFLTSGLWFLTSDFSNPE